MFLKYVSYWKKGLIIGLLISVILSFGVGIIFTLIPSIIEGKLVCGTLGGEVDCKNILVFLLFILVYALWTFLFTFLPLMILGALIGFIIDKIKSSR